MSTANQQQIAELERAILDRARELADELRDKADHRRDAILREANEKLRRDEERAGQSARIAAERAERRRVQATELKLQGQLDQLRWELVQAVRSRLQEQMQALREDRAAYRAWLIERLAEGAALLPDGDLKAEVIAEDLNWLEDEWDQLVTEAAPGRRIALSNQATWGLGGVKLRNADNTAQLDNRFEGRMTRFETEIQRVILTQLFPNSGGLSS